ncbi:MAG TPA: hypothetical protein VMU24_01785 [Candidatus Acidoferrales bacterium]|nr:hypothetical protein [Candidatus Acidoferrales bacterium]
MDADWSVELGADDPVLEMPWTSPDGALCWHNLAANPKLISELAECRAYPELVEPLRRLNSPESCVLTAKCDVYPTEPTEPAEELYGDWRFVSYVDIFFAHARQNHEDAMPVSDFASSRAKRDDFTPAAANFDFNLHEQFARNLSARLNDRPDCDVINATVETVIRRCAYKHSGDGFYFTIYVVGYGESGEIARQHWATALNAAAVEGSASAARVLREVSGKSR